MKSILEEELKIAIKQVMHMVIRTRKKNLLYYILGASKYIHRKKYKYIKENPHDNSTGSILSLQNSH